MLINYYVSEKYINKVFHEFDQMKHKGYYAWMAVAWAISIYFKVSELTAAYLSNSNLDEITYKKALQKIKRI